MKNFADYSIRDYVAVASTDAPTPGGGSVAAVVGALGAALGQMVYHLSIHKKSYQAHDEATKAAVECDFQALEALQEDFIRLIDEDVAAFNTFMEALRLPKATDEERKIRQDAMEQASIVATKAPLETAIKAFETLERIEELARYGHKNCISDAGVSAYCAFAALQSAVMNVRINLGGISDEVFTSETEALCVRLVDEAEVKTNKIVQVVYDRL